MRRIHIPFTRKSFTVKRIVTLATWAISIGLILFLAYFIYLQQTLPAPESIVSRQFKESTKIYDSTGQVLLYDVYGEEKRTIIPWEQIPDTVKNATLAAEDNSFYSHGGVDIRGILRSFWVDIKTGGLTQGGSTITQQLIKNALLGAQTSAFQKVSRKIREIILSIEVEQQFSKDQILWMYLNQIPYGSNAYGIEAAAKTYFGKSASELDLAESASLGAIIQAPTRYSPFGSHVDELLARKDFVLHRMKDLNFITQDQLTSALAEKLNFQKNIVQLQAPHFVIMARDYLIQKYGKDIIETGGFKITTTLDADMQKNAEELVSKYAAINKARYKASNSALVAIDPKTGDVKALVGSANYFDVSNQGNFNVALSPNRQPGSSFKPFAYAAAFQKGYPDFTVLFDLKTEFNPNCSPDANQKTDKYGLACYHPKNYDGLYRGPVTMRQALAQSLNVPSVETLYLAGVQNTIDLAQKMGITTLTKPDSYGLSLVLGGAETRLVDMVSAYSVFANDGIRNPWNFIKKIELSDGTVLEQEQLNPTRVLDQQTSRLVSDVLSDNNARGPVFGYSSPLYLPGREVAAKTGTTQDNRDAWVIGYTPSLAVGVWSGNNDNSPMTAAGAGISASGPLWHDFMTKSLSGTPAEAFPNPDPINVNKIMLNGTYRTDAQPDIHSILYYVNRDDPLGPYPTTPDSLLANWEYPLHLFFTPTPLPQPTQFPPPQPVDNSTPLPSDPTPWPTPFPQ